MKHCYGQFTISRVLIESNPKLVKKIMGDCIILKADFMYTDASVHYHAYSDSFEELSDGGVTPFYTISIIKEPRKRIRFEWVKE